MIDKLSAGVVPGKQIHHLLYTDLVGDPMQAVENLYRHFGIPLSLEGQKAMAQYLADHPRDARPPHKFSIGSGAEVARARKAFKRYQDYFKVPSE